MKLFPGETKSKKLSYNQLRQTVCHANEEAQGYLSETIRLREEIEVLERRLAFLENHAKLRKHQMKQIEAWAACVMPLDGDWKGPGF